MTAVSIEALNVFDYVIFGVILLSTVVSFFRGFLRELVSLIIWVLAIMLAFKFSEPVAQYLQAYIDSHLLRFVIAFAGIFFIILILGALINLAVKLVVDKIGLSLLDRLFGLVFGAARGVLAVAVVLMFIQVSPFQKQAWVKTSQLAPQFKPIVTWLQSFLPKPVAQVSAWMSGKKG